MKKRIFSAVSALMITVLAITACAPSASSPSSCNQTDSSASQKLIKDKQGHEISIPATVNRIISTAPSNTEILVGLGLSDKLVAIDQYSADMKGVSQDIPQIDFDHPDAEVLIKLKPDIIIASGYNNAGGEDPYALLKEAGIFVATIESSNSIDEIRKDIGFIARLTGTETQGQKLIKNYTAEIEKIKAIGKTVSKKKKVYFEISPAPNLGSFGKGTFLNEFIEIIGAENIYKNEKGWLIPNAESIIKANPDVILTNASYLDNSVNEIKSRSGWNTINAIKNGQVFLIEANASSRPSKYSVNALKQIAKAVYPKYYE